MIDPEVYQPPPAVSTAKRRESVPFAATVYEIAWSPDGARLLAAPLDDTVVRLEAPPLAAR